MILNKLKWEGEIIIDGIRYNSVDEIPRELELTDDMNI